MNEQFKATTDELMVKAAWNITYTSFWNTWTLSAHEMNFTRSFIRKFINSRPDKYNAYLEYCQRVLLAREYIIKNPDKFVPIPSKWLSTDNPNGFTGTERWFQNMQLMRKALPLYHNQFKALPEAVLEMLEEPKGRIFHYWRTWFIEREKHATANLFLSILANFTFHFSKG